MPRRKDAEREAGPEVSTICEAAREGCQSGQKSVNYSQRKHYDPKILQVCSNTSAFFLPVISYELGMRALYSRRL